MQLGIAIVNDFKSIEGDRTLGLQVILLFIISFLNSTQMVSLCEFMCIFVVASCCFWDGNCKMDMCRSN
jgi:hypothetical protein